LLVLVPVIVLLATGLVFSRHLSSQFHARTAAPVQPLFTVPLLAVASGSAVPSVPPPVPASVPGPHDPRARWIADVSADTDIPRRVLQAYVSAAEATARRLPGCHVTWATLAGFGRIESDHGEHHGDSVGPDGREVRPIIGPALDGSPGVRRIADTDHGVLDGDVVWDRAVGPMQFLPSRWRELGLRAAGDGHSPDPQDIDDAALTAAAYLCDAGGDLAVPARWWKAAFTYNNSVAYGRAVFSAADAYARVAARTRP
jgi:membrane-bound lytic murein transglycosylase B